MDKITMAYIIPIFLFSAGILLFFVWIIVGMFMSVNQSHVNYYKDDNNFEEVICVLSEHEYTGNMFFRVEGKYGYSESLWLWERNKAAVDNSGFWDDVSIGDVVTVVTAPGYFWDSYDYPIVALKTEIKTYLDFDTGKENQVAQLQEMRNKYLSVAVPLIISSSTSVLSAIFLSAVVLIIDKKRNLKIM